MLSKCVLQLGGPLIRVYGDRHGWNVRLATLEALNELIKKVFVAFNKLCLSEMFVL